MVVVVGKKEGPNVETEEKTVAINCAGEGTPSGRTKGKRNDLVV